MKTRNVKKIQIEKRKNGVIIEICNVIEDERTVCSERLSEKEVIQLIQQLFETIT